MNELDVSWRFDVSWVVELDVSSDDAPQLALDPGAFLQCENLNYIFFAFIFTMFTQLFPLNKFDDVRTLL